MLTHCNKVVNICYLWHDVFRIAINININNPIGIETSYTMSLLLVLEPNEPFLKARSPANHFTDVFHSVHSSNRQAPQAQVLASCSAQGS